MSMNVRASEKFIAYLALATGLSISAVAVYYSVVGLTAIFAAAALPIIIMGTTLEISKLVATVWLKQNWTTSPKTIRAYLVTAVAVLMLITSMGIFGFLSKAHLDQSVPSGDVAAKVSLYDEKIATQRENIKAARANLSQLDAAVNETMGRSTDERGAEKAVAIRRTQAKDRAKLTTEIEQAQNEITKLQEQRAPLAAEQRKVEAEVGPIKYIAAFFYGATDQTILEKAVTWVIILIISVFDPLAVILLLASQISCQNFRDREDQQEAKDNEEAELERWNKMVQAAEEESLKERHPVPADIVAQEIMSVIPEAVILEEEEPPIIEEEVTPKKNPLTDEEIDQIQELAEQQIQEAVVTPEIEPEPVVEEIPSMERPGDYTPTTTFDYTTLPPDQEYVMIDGHNMHIRAAKALHPQTPTESDGYVQNEEQSQSGVWNRVISEAEYRDRAVTVSKTNDAKNNTNNSA